MDIKSALLDRHSKATVMEIAAFIAEDSSRFDQLMDCVLSDEVLLVQRGSWALRWTVAKNPALILPYLAELLRKMDRDIHVALKRNVLKILEELDPIPADLQEVVIDKCFQYLENRKETVAVRVFSMTVLARECREYPELLQELKMLIETYLPHESAGFQSRGRKILKHLQK